MDNEKRRGYETFELDFEVPVDHSYTISKFKNYLINRDQLVALTEKSPEELGVDAFHVHENELRNAKNCDAHSKAVGLAMALVKADLFDGIHWEKVNVENGRQPLDVGRVVHIPMKKLGEGPDYFPLKVIVDHELRVFCWSVIMGCKIKDYEAFANHLNAEVEGEKRLEVFRKAYMGEDYDRDFLMSQVY